MFKRLLCWAYFLGSLFSEGLIIGTNFAFQNGLGLTIKTAYSNFPWAYIREGFVFNIGRIRYWRLRFGGPYFREALFIGGLLSEFYGKSLRPCHFVWFGSISRRNVHKVLKNNAQIQPARRSFLPSWLTIKFKRKYREFRIFTSVCKHSVFGLRQENLKWCSLGYVTIISVYIPSCKCAFYTGILSWDRLGMWSSWQKGRYTLWEYRIGSILISNSPK